MYCLKNAQECIIRFKNSRRSREFLNVIIHDREVFFTGFKISKIDQLILALIAGSTASSETQGQSVGSGEKAGQKFSSTGKRAPGYRLSPNFFPKFKWMSAPDWAQKVLCIIVPNQRTVSPEFFS